MIKCISGLTRAALFLVVMCVGSGCITGELWNWAGSVDTASFNKVAGITPAAKGGSQSLIVTYTEYHGDAVLLIPLDAQGRPVAPFAYAGSARTQAEFWKSIAPAQTAEILRRTGDLRDDSAAKGPMSHLATDKPEWDYLDETGDKLTAVALRIDGPRIVQVPVVHYVGPSRTPEEKAVGQVVAGASIALVPRTVVLDPSQGILRSISGIVLTPVTAVCDGVLIVINIPVVIVGGLMSATEPIRQK